MNARAVWLDTRATMALWVRTPTVTEVAPVWAYRQFDTAPNLTDQQIEQISRIITATDE